mmetsp:Transcript_13053/g.30477  ORF Transcript_13053/g.30477 Transcript_13053/m.30477 type:complete len:205 (-) Transcript_13053:1424-2038(-)
MDFSLGVVRSKDYRNLSLPPRSVHRSVVDNNDLFYTSTPNNLCNSILVQFSSWLVSVSLPFEETVELVSSSFFSFLSHPVSRSLLVLSSSSIEARPIHSSSLLYPTMQAGIFARSQAASQMPVPSTKRHKRIIQMLNGEPRYSMGKKFAVTLQDKLAKMVETNAFNKPLSKKTAWIWGLTPKRVWPSTFISTVIIRAIMNMMTV